MKVLLRVLFTAVLIAGVAQPAPAQYFGNGDPDLWVYSIRPANTGKYKRCSWDGYDTVPCPELGAPVAAREGVGDDPVAAAQHPAAVEPDPLAGLEPEPPPVVRRQSLISPELRARLFDRAAAQAEKRFDAEVEEHPERSAPCAWVFRDEAKKIKGDVGMSLSLFARPSHVKWLRGRWVTIAAFLGKSTAGVGVAWELTPHRPRLEGAPRRLEIWAGPVFVTPWGQAGELALTLGLGVGVRL